MSTRVSGRPVLAIYIAVVIALLTGAAFWIQSQRDTSGDAADRVPSTTTDAFGFRFGDPQEAVAEVVIYEDFMCPGCKQFETTYLNVLRGLVGAGEITVEYRPMSFLDGKTPNKYSTRAFNALTHVHEHDGAETAERFREGLWSIQPEPGSTRTDADLVTLGREVGVDVSALEVAVKDLRYEQWIVNAADAASKAGIHQSPTVLLNGDVLDDPFYGLITALSKAGVNI